MRICKVKNCDTKHFAKGYCIRHYRQISIHNKILKRTRCDKNEIIDCSDYYEICLYKGQSEQVEIARTKIDKDDLERARQHKWCLTGDGYSSTAIKKTINKRIRLHQFIIGRKKKLMIDHINHDKLDNRKQNLRHCTNAENCKNKKTYVKSK